MLPSNGRCLQSHYLATGLHARICSAIFFFLQIRSVHFKHLVQEKDGNVDMKKYVNYVPFLLALLPLEHVAEIKQT
jgi:hypothetical protein